MRTPLYASQLTMRPLLSVLALLSVTAVTVYAKDMTLEPGALGSPVVETAVDRLRAACIFSSDKLFLRRLAYVETSDGHDPKTYRPGYHGGIWQVCDEL